MVDSTCNGNEYQEYFLRGKDGRCIGLTTLPPSCADCFEIWKSQPPVTLSACPGLKWDCFTVYICDICKHRVYHSQSKWLITYCHKDEKHNRNVTRQPCCHFTRHKRRLR